MEVSAPVTQQVVTVMQGRKRTDLVFASRGECRALIAQVALAMEQLPGDGDDEVDAAVYCGGRAPWGDECTLEDGHEPPHVDTSDREWHDGRPFDAGEGSRTLGSPGRELPAAAVAEEDEDGPMDDEAELRRAELIRARRARLAALGQRVAALSQPAPGQSGAACGARPYPAGSEGDDGTECVLPAGHDGPHDDGPAPKYELGDAVRARFQREPLPLASVTPLAPVTRVVDGEPVEQEPCPHVHPDTGESCVGLMCHEPPCRDAEGDEWVPAGSAVTA